MKSSNYRTSLIAIAFSMVLSACGGGGSANAPPDNKNDLNLNDNKPKLSADQAIYEQLALNGGIASITWNAPYGGGTMVSGTNYAYVSTNGALSQSPLLGVQNDTSTLSSLIDSLSLPTSAKNPSRYLSNGAFVDRLPDAPRRVSYINDGVQVELLSSDGKTTLEVDMNSAYTLIPLTGSLNDAPVEFQAKYPLYKIINGNNLERDTQWKTGSAYVKRAVTVIGDTYFTSDCNTDSTVTPTATTDGTPNKCFSGSLTEASFPITQWSKPGHTSERNTFSQGTLTKVQGLPMWIANQPFRSNKQRYRIFFELAGGVYAGYLMKDGSKYQYSQSDGSYVDYNLSLNQTAVQSIKSGLVIQPPTAGTKTGRPDTVAASNDVYGIGGTAINGALSAADLRKHYQVPTDLSGAGQTIAIIDLPGDADVLADLNVYSAANGLPSMQVCNSAMSNSPCLKTTDLSGNPVSDTKTKNTWALEIALDTQMVHALAPQANIVLVLLSSLTPSAINNAIDGLPITAVSMSFHTGLSSVPKVNAAQNTALLNGINSGLIYFASSGDGGANESLAHAPAISPYVTAVGGTRVTSVDNLNGDQAWQFSGGGYAGTTAASLPMPAWQQSVLTAAQKTASGGFLAVPDVAAVGDVQLAIYYKQAWVMEGGTSASAPIWAGISALLGEYFANKNSSLKDFVKSYPGGFNEALYTVKAQQGNVVGLVDVTVGSNTTLSATDCATCSAGAGYDFITGLGSPSVSNLANILLSLWAAKTANQ